MVTVVFGGREAVDERIAESDLPKKLDLTVPDGDGWRTASRAHEADWTVLDIRVHQRGAPPPVMTWQESQKYPDDELRRHHRVVPLTNLRVRDSLGLGPEEESVHDRYLLDDVAALILEPAETSPEPRDRTLMDEVIEWIRRAFVKGGRPITTPLEDLRMELMIHLATNHRKVRTLATLAPGYLRRQLAQRGLDYVRSQERKAQKHLSLDELLDAWDAADGGDDKPVSADVAELQDKLTDDQDEPAADPIAMRRMLRALAAMPREHARAVYLRHGLGYSVGAIAKFEGIAQATASYRIAKGEEALRKALA